MLNTCMQTINSLVKCQNIYRHIFNGKLQPCIAPKVQEVLRYSGLQEKAIYYTKSNPLAYHNYNYVVYRMSLLSALVEHLPRLHFPGHYQSGGQVLQHRCH